MVSYEHTFTEINQYTDVEKGAFVKWEQTKVKESEGKIKCHL